MADAVPELADLAGEDALVHAGGPVNPESVLALGDVDGEPELLAPDGLLDRGAAAACGCSPATPAGRRASSTASSRRRPGSRSPAAPDDAFAEIDLWPEVLQRKGGSYALMATMPDDPTLN